MPSPVVRSLPNWFTIANLLCGIFSIILNMNGLVWLSAILIFAAALMDLFDGRIARRLNVSSEVGVELDSLADIVSFGVAPALIVYTLTSPSMLASFAFTFYAAMGALRLARFSASPTVGYFMGIPIPMAGMVIAGMALFDYSNAYITILLAILMVSPIRVKKF
ncbi:CDP-diacylglycerol--serine O-phosphatidyltransferase [Neobacillus piezotolerans]|uniref:CDP-diacylglycerol--serine O-phosphatidyltransferase n=1 Tax=Neobacillus piezotolerans TaxID=2259171 RepID=A0A3D8GQC3_9BACI|nr:CDP-diacylglycerol--serine O-phosphatidyltransferase [Neobacillus piezotolerans]RDU36527.1 CDP-diacylglycerol--serine O-phosphatidyltransferase [Neobacillus piezotolerans]